MSGILAGCGGTQSQIPITPQTPTPPQSPNPFDSVSFPQVSCGDQPPDDPQAYPVEFYPVYIDYSENNLQKVNQLFCRAVDWNQDVIYLGYFYSRKRAEDFKDIMIREMKSGYVGEAIVVTDTPYVEPNPTNETINHYVAKDYFINSGILTDSQAKQLEFLDSLKSDRGTDVKVAIPTYIPSGFKIERFKVQTDPPSPSYQIAYKNKSNHCFFIMGGTGGFGDAPHVSINVEVFSPIFGVITLEYLSFDQNKEQVGIRGDSFVKDGNAYNFESPRWERTETPCQGIKLQETVKILKSLRYLKSF
jgi:hypothetical protein